MIKESFPVPPFGPGGLELSLLKSFYISIEIKLVFPRVMLELDKSYKMVC